eukprot:s1629_g34.t1
MREAFAQNFPPLSRSRSSHAGANRGHDTADRGASRALQIERARVRTAERAAAVARLKEDLARLYRDTTAFRAEEVRLKTQAESETWRGGQQREAGPPDHRSPSSGRTARPVSCSGAGTYQLLQALVLPGQEGLLVLPDSQATLVRPGLPHSLVLPGK